MLAFGGGSGGGGARFVGRTIASAFEAADEDDNTNTPVRKRRTFWAHCCVRPHLERLLVLVLVLAPLLHVCTAACNVVVEFCIVNNSAPLRSPLSLSFSPYIRTGCS